MKTVTKKTSGTKKTTNAIEIHPVKLAVYNAIKSLGEALTNDIAKKAGVGSDKVRHYGYQMFEVDKWVAISESDGRQFYFSLTPAGKKVKLVAKKKAVVTKKAVATTATKKKIGQR